jgi:hypothetical protein
MIKRCLNPKYIGYARYGGRGICFDPRWDKFENFLSDMGERPDGCTLERLHTDRNYWRGNCIWLPAELQQLNKSSNRLITWRLRTLCIAEWGRQLGINRRTLAKRLNLGWSVDEAFTTPLRGS